MAPIVRGTIVHDRYGIVGRVTLVDVDADTALVTILVQRESGEMRWFAPDAYWVVNGVVVLAEASSTGDGVAVA